MSKEKEYIKWKCLYCGDTFESLKEDLEFETGNHWDDHKEENIEVSLN